MELDQGGIYIDGLDVSKLGLAQLRNSMAIIPQVGPPFMQLVVPSIGSWASEQNHICRVPVVYHVSMVPLPFSLTSAVCTEAYLASSSVPRLSQKKRLL